MEDRVEVKIKEGPPCPDCGTVGPHYCTKGQKQGKVYVGVYEYGGKDRRHR